MLHELPILRAKTAVKIPIVAIYRSKFRWIWLCWYHLFRSDM